jgi:hypothetical protein
VDKIPLEFKTLGTAEDVDWQTYHTAYEAVESILSAPYNLQVIIVRDRGEEIHFRKERTPVETLEDKVKRLEARIKKLESDSTTYMRHTRVY